MTVGHFSRITLGDGLTGTDLGADVIEIAATPGTADPADDPAVWMPLTSVMAGEPVLVWDGDDSLIPTLIPV